MEEAEIYNNLKYVFFAPRKSAELSRTVYDYVPMSSGNKEWSGLTIGVSQ